MRPLNLEQLNTFLTVVRLGGIRRAATALHLTQPAVSARIRALEETLATPLFERTTSGLRPTARGELLLRHAERFEAMAAAVEREVADPAGLQRQLRLGVSETIAQTWLTDFVTRLHQHHPALQIEIKVDISLNLRTELLDRELDLAILLGPVSEYTIDNLELPGCPLAWYTAADSPDPDDPAGWFDQPVITYARHTRPYRELKRALFERVGPWVRLFPTSSLSAGFRLIEAGLGVGALPTAMGDPLCEAGRIRRFDPDWLPAPLQFCAAWSGEPENPLLPAAAQLALDVARTAGDQKFLP